MAAPAPQQTYYLILPPQPPELELPARPVARLLQEEEANVPGLFKSPGYTVLRRFAKVANAEGLKQQLEAFGARAFVVSDGALRGHLFIWVKDARHGGGGMALTDFAGQPIFCPWNDIAALVLMEVERVDGTLTRWVDLVRKSSPVTPRLDTAMFDFPAMMNRSDATLRHFLDTLEESSACAVDMGFGRSQKAMAQVVADLATAPSEVAPPSAALPQGYARAAHRAANAYSFLRRHDLLEGGKG
ncbi:MAG: hypothetical protein SF028_12000 [Candidatus Sumerlaeia bacterium]|nr:hypothetical protein [Candidatus Sumerlaeia bacterium]